MSGRVDFDGIELEWAFRTDVGRKRVLNEDSLLARPPVFLVADGMGGHAAGEVASALMVEQMSALCVGDLLELEDVASTIERVNRTLVHMAGVDGTATMGTTVTGLALVRHQGLPAWLVFNVGDSRSYSRIGGVVHQLTKDHSYVQELVDSGEIEAWEAWSHPHRNVVTRAVGAEATVVPDYWVRPVRAGERLLVCSDGLTGEVEQGVLAAALEAEISLEALAESLVDLALEAGGSDNVTVVVVDVVAVAVRDEPTTETRPKSTGVAATALLEPPLVEEVTAEHLGLIDLVPGATGAAPQSPVDVPERRRIFDAADPMFIARVPGGARRRPSASTPSGSDSPDLIEGMPSGLARPAGAASPADDVDGE